MAKCAQIDQLWYKAKWCQFCESLSILSLNLYFVYNLYTSFPVASILAFVWEETVVTQETSLVTIWLSHLHSPGTEHGLQQWKESLLSLP